MLVVQGKLVMEAARRTEGFSGRELAKLMASVQAAAYGTASAKLSDEVRYNRFLFKTRISKLFPPARHFLHV